MFASPYKSVRILTTPCHFLRFLKNLCEIVRILASPYEFLRIHEFSRILTNPYEPIRIHSNPCELVQILTNPYQVCLRLQPVLLKICVHTARIQQPAFAYTHTHTRQSSF